MYSRVILRAPEHMQSHWASHRTVWSAKDPFTLILYDSQSLINFAKKKFHHHRFTLCGEWYLAVNLLILSTHHLHFMWLSNRISKYKHAQRYVKPTTLKVATASIEHRKTPKIAATIKLHWMSAKKLNHEWTIGASQILFGWLICSSSCIGEADALTRLPSYWHHKKPIMWNRTCCPVPCWLQCDMNLLHHIILLNKCSVSIPTQDLRTHGLVVRSLMLFGDGVLSKHVHDEDHADGLLQMNWVEINPCKLMSILDSFHSTCVIFHLLWLHWRIRI